MQLATRIDKFHKTTLGYLVFGLVELGLAFGVALWAVDSGYIWLYTAGLILIVGVLLNLVKLTGKLLNV